MTRHLKDKTDDVLYRLLSTLDEVETAIESQRKNLRELRLQIHDEMVQRSGAMTEGQVVIQWTTEKLVLLCELYLKAKEAGVKQFQFSEPDGPVELVTVYAKYLCEYLGTKVRLTRELDGLLRKVKE